MTVRKTLSFSFMLILLVLISCASQIGSRSFHRRLLILFASISLIFTYFNLNNMHNNSFSNTDTVWAINEDLLKLEIIPYSIFTISLFTASIFVCFSIISGYVLPLDTIFVSFFYGYFTSLTDQQYDKLPIYLKKMPTTFMVSYLVMPAVSACITWFTYRILIRGVIYSDEEELFNRTLGWCGIIYPTAISAVFTILALKFLIHNSNFGTKALLGYIVIISSWLFAYVLFKVLIRAWIKRRAFLMYPQEYAVYMERSEKVEQGDREARGLGPIQNYYLPKISGTNSSSLTTTGTKPIRQFSISIIDSNSTVEPVISPAVIAGKLAISSKRAEELFSPILNVISIVSLFFFSSFESSNLYSIVYFSIQSRPSIWLVLIAILIGAAILSNRHGWFLGRSIISDMRFSQAFSIQLGVLLTMTVALLHSIPLAPMWYLVASIAAVCATNSDRSNNYLNHIHMQPTLLETDTADEEEEKGSYRSKLCLLMLFWICSIGFGFSVGFLSSLLL